MSKKLSTAEWIARAREKHGDRYDYSRAVYEGADRKLIVACRLHGEFETHPSTHIRAGGCPACAGKGSNPDGSLTTEEFISRAKALHGSEYDYSKSCYVNAHTKIDIVCRQHGLFSQTPGNHLSGRGCPTCAQESRAEKRKISPSDVMSRVAKAHGLKYIYFIDFYTTEEDFKFMCPTHGIIHQRLAYHISLSGCKKCHAMRLAQERPGALTVSILKEYLDVDFNSGVITHKIPYKRKKSWRSGEVNLQLRRVRNILFAGAHYSCTQSGVVYS